MPYEPIPIPIKVSMKPPTQRDLREVARVTKLMEQSNAIFVFGSNLAGRHGAGAAKVALELYGAQYGLGEGLYGRSYALPTKDHFVETLNLFTVEQHIGYFVQFAREHPELLFAVTRIGCGLAGFKDSDIAPLFARLDPPRNCKLPEGW